MRKSWLIVLLLLTVLSLFADEFVVTQEIQKNPTSLVLTRMDSKDITDINGNKVGLVIIRTGIKDMLVESSFLHKLEPKSGEYYVFLSPGTKYFTLKKEGFGNMKYDLREKTGGIESGYVYEMAVANRASGTIVGDADLLTLTLNLNETNVYISKENSAPTQAKSNLAVFRLAAGKYKFSFYKEGFESYEEIIDINSDKTHNITLKSGKSSQKIPVTGFATINSEPEGAEILINGQKVGVTPFTADELFPGEHELSLRKNLYHSQTMTFTLKEGENYAPETIILKPKFGYLTVNSAPEKASVSLDNKPYGSTPVMKTKIESGSHNIKIRYDLYHEYEENFIINDGDNKIISAELEPAFGTLVINSGPEDGAEVFIGIEGKAVGKTPYTNSKMPSGKYVVRISKTLWAEAEETIEVKDGQKTERTLVLTKNFGTLDITAKNATIKLDGEIIGSDSALRNLSPGKYTVKAEIDRHHPDEKEVYVRVGEKTEITLTPQPMEGVVSVKCQAKDKPGPDVGAELWLNGQQMDKTSPSSFSLLTGDYTLLAKHNKYLDTERKFTVAEGDRLKLELNMETYSGSMLSRSNWWRTHKWIGMGTTLLAGGGTVFFYLQSSKAYDNQTNATSSSDASSYYDDYKSYKNMRNICLGVAGTTTVYTIYSWIKQAGYNKKS